MLKNIDDSKLLRLLISGNEDSLQHIFERYYSTVLSFMIRQCRTEEDAEDLTQEVFLKLWNGRNNLSEVASLKAYLFTMSRNTFIDHLRKRVNQIVFEKVNENLSLLDDVDNDEQDLINTIYILAQQLPPKQLEVFKLRWIEGLSRKEIAERMEISVVTVDIHIRKVLEHLRGKMRTNNLMNLFFLF